MNQEPKDRALRGPKESLTGTKKPYQRPSCRYEKVFETMALSCGKVNTTQGSCAHNRKSS